MDDDQIAARSMFSFVFLLVLLGILVLIGGLFGDWPFLVRLVLGAPIIIGGLMLGRWYIRRI